ncbi:hypothetical protein LUZ60_003460 [Juncus effusus]|nr:hypothetical protein LUZ60_003460 [Juncus effusus]
MGSWIRTISSPFRKSCISFNPPREQQKTQSENDRKRSELHVEVMACAYHDVQVMWSILDKSSVGPTGS